MAAGKHIYEVFLTDGAEQDLESIYNYITEFDCAENADYVLDQLADVIEHLSQFPERGSYPNELKALGIREYKQALFKPYRVIYRIIDSNVIIYVIVDGRRDMQSLLEKRLLAAVQ
jgi:toxin ParE1/3/4